MRKIRRNGAQKRPAVEAPSVRKVPQLYSPKASYIASQLYYATHSYIALRAVLRADIISRKPIGFHITLPKGKISL